MCPRVRGMTSLLAQLSAAQKDIATFHNRTPAAVFRLMDPRGLMTRGFGPGAACGIFFCVWFEIRARDVPGCRHQAEALSRAFFVQCMHDASVCTFRQMSFTACIQRSLLVNTSALKVTDRVLLIHDRSRCLFDASLLMQFNSVSAQYFLRKC